MPSWTLADLYPAADGAELTSDLARIARDSEAFKARYQGKLGPRGADGGYLAEAVKDYEAIADLMGRLGSFAFLNYAGDQQDAARVKLFGDVQGKLTEASNNLIFFELELNQIPEADIEAALAHADLARYRPWFEDLRKEKPYQLDEKLELLFNDKAQTAGRAWNRLFDETMASLRFEVAGEPEPLPLEPTLNLMTDPKEPRRRAAAEALAKTFQKNIRLFTLVTNTLAKDKEISDRWRGFKDIADGRHLANKVEGPVVEALVSAVRESYPKLSHRYYRMKAKWLGMDKLAHWDRNAPLPEKPERVVPWTEARDLVLTAYRGFAPEMAQIAGDFFDKRWIDAPSRPGKASGAFSHPTVPSAHPYVLLNYQGKSRDVMTLAHELGHGVHQVLAGKQGPLLAPTPLTLAETASVFGEMLTFRALLADTTNPRERKALIAGKVEDMLNTVVRQIAFYEFERKIHTARREGELTSDQINEMWMSVQGESLGDAIEFKPGYEVFWAYIGHFIHAPFYVYAYAFGDCLVNSLYALYEEAHPDFVQKYFDLLKAGGSKHHSELLRPFGLDASQPEFWHKGLGMIERMIDELEAMEQAA
ncbi:MAG: M3 family oligoendopeptidase [Hyphomicrobiaceae bacterium]|nr:M3 family oligoendopeptidase [Hyphomicrobiaceae bacterium]